ncbi:MAG TPA: hypothetical protein VLA36_09140 [Longimicrobiales bacterium]|nr:hypothetical protein [Longimicrobiales bacterium]
MSRRVLASGAAPCVWMCAGVLRYHLCTHDYDCDGCPLDAALRGDEEVRHRRALPPAPVEAFPDDRYYAAGHTWLKAVPSSRDGAWRLGLDAFAAAMVADTRVVSWDGAPGLVRPGDRVCTLDLGLGCIEVRSPLRARVLRDNDVLRAFPGRVVTQPYESGWLVELAPADPRDVEGLLTATGARKAAFRDLCNLRRTVALNLLRDPDGDRGRDEPNLATRDLRWLLGGYRYVEILGELVH